ncbi:MAG: hypothetical protein JW963_11315 [Anaerolineales bacterium]|nr:hypothetical protein [Anaerolineales bacterium]
MAFSPILIGKGEYQSTKGEVGGEYVTLLGEPYYCIRNYDRLPPFFMSIVSSADHWLFISSTGGLTAGRINAESALFPYGTDDKVSESYEHTGPLSIFLVKREGHISLWEPFSQRYAGLYPIERKLYKNIGGDKLIFEESNLELGLTCRRAWRTSDRFGFVHTTWLYNQSSDPVTVNLLSGIQNILPYGVTTLLYSNFSNLLNAYKRCELDLGSGLGIFSLSATLTDQAEPSESLQATTAWQVGLERPRHLLSSLQVDTFRSGAEIVPETDIRGCRGAYLVNTELSLASGETKEWSILLDVNQDSVAITALVNRLKRLQAEIAAEIEADVAKGSDKLRAIIASADGLQVTGDRLSSVHHYANVLFNTMRGGIFADNYKVGKSDLVDFLRVRNRTVLERQAAFLENLPEQITIMDLLPRTSQTIAPDLVRLCYEYLPLTFSRRHGDPSRPWNRFSINLKNPDGSQRLDYQGNWRDIFQNWEPLACSYPEFVESMIAKFVNAGTPDGYNPYRVTRDGIEWEVPEPENPWANIGYWSDHQIIYLQKLLEISVRYHPGKLQGLLNRRIFSYANVPYRLREYQALLVDPYHTMDFDRDAHRQTEEIVATLGSDGKLVHGTDGEIFHVTLSEKLLVLLLAKLVNFVPEGGIWMNTQRPEWNDANNALVGKGLSVVTLGYLRRYVVFWLSLLDKLDAEILEVSREVKTLFADVSTVLTQYAPGLSASFSDPKRRTVMDALGQAGSDYRWRIYREGFCGEIESLSVSELKAFLALAQQYIEQTLRTNRRDDGLYHAYNILKLGEGTASINYLYEMLEGQVSILSSGLLTPTEALALLQNLRESALFRADQHSYILYPDRNLPAFLVKNRLPPEQVRGIGLVKALADHNERSLIVRDENGDFCFNGTFHNARDVQGALKQLGQQEAYADLVSMDGEKILALFESLFDHSSFTGRSGTFFAYEGLGSIYWHMVAKLLLAAQENYLLAVERGADEAIVRALAECYHDIRLGLGFNKSPDVYGAFPTDPYSHTPAGQGAKQPGMTGQVKEEILTRLVELGLFVRNGQIVFNPTLLRKDEFTTQAMVFEYIDLEGGAQRIDLPAGSLAFTFCQVPVVYHASDETRITVHFSDGRVTEISGNQLDFETSLHIFQRDRMVGKLFVEVAIS